MGKPGEVPADPPGRATKKAACAGEVEEAAGHAAVFPTTETPSARVAQMNRSTSSGTKRNNRSPTRQAGTLPNRTHRSSVSGVTPSRRAVSLVESNSPITTPLRVVMGNYAGTGKVLSIEQSQAGKILLFNTAKVRTALLRRRSPALFVLGNPQQLPGIVSVNLGNSSESDT